MFKLIVRLNIVLFVSFSVAAKPQLLSGSGGLLGSLLGGPSSGSVKNDSKDIVSFKDNQQVVDHQSQLQGLLEDDFTGLRIPAGVNLPFDLLSNNLQVGEGSGGILNSESNKRIFDQSTDLVGIGHRKTGLAQVPIEANAPLKLITQNTQFAEGPGGIENILRNLQKVDQSSVLHGLDNHKSDLAQAAVQASAPLKALAQNVQISEGPEGISNTQINTQKVQQSSDIIGFDNQKFSAVHLPVAASVPINVLRQNLQTALKGQGGNIDNIDINNQKFDQSSKMGVGNQESNLLQGAVGARSPINVLTQNVQIIEGSEGDINNIKLSRQEVDQSSKLKGADLSKSSFLQLGALVGAPIDLLTGNKQVIAGEAKEGILNRLLGSKAGGIKNIKGNLQNADLSDTLEGSNISKTDGLLVAPQALLDIKGLTQNLQKTSGGGIENVDLNAQRIDQSTDLVGIGHRKTGLAQVPIEANAPLKLITQNTQFAEGPGGIENILRNLQKVDQSSVLHGLDNHKSDLAQAAVQASAPLKALAQNVQISEGPEGISNTQINTQKVQQSSDIIGFDNQKFSAVHLPVAASVPINVLRQNLQTALKGQGGNIDNIDINNQKFDQSSKMGVGNQESNLLQGAVGARSPINVLTQNVQIIEGSEGDINNIKLSRQEVDQSSKLKGADLSKSSFLQLGALVGAPIDLLTGNKQVIAGEAKEGILNRLLGSKAGGIKNIKGNLQNADLSDTLEGSNISKTDGLLVAPQALLDIKGLTQNLQKTSGGGIENVDLNAQRINTDTNITGSNITKFQLGRVAPQAQLLAKLLNKNGQSTGTKEGEKLGILNAILNTQENTNRIFLNGSNTKVIQLLDINPELILDLGLAELTEQKTGSPGSAKHKDITKQVSDNLVLMMGDNNEVIRGAVVNTQGVVKLRLGEIVKQVTSLVGGKELTDEECEEVGEDIIIQEQKSDVTQIGENNTISTLAKVGGQLIVDTNVATNLLQKIRCKGRKSTTKKPTTDVPTLTTLEPLTLSPTQPPIWPPTGPPTLPSTLTSAKPPTQPPSLPPTQPPIKPTLPPTSPSTQPPPLSTAFLPIKPSTLPPTQPTTLPPILPTLTPTLPPTESPTLPPTLPQTLPPTLLTVPPTFPPISPSTQLPTESTTLPPTPPPTSPSTQPPNEPTTLTQTLPPTLLSTIPPTQHTTESPTLLPTQPPTLSPTLPPTQPPTLPPILPLTEPPTIPPTQPPIQPPTLPPTDKPTQPTTHPPTFPPTEPPTLPPTQPPILPPTQPPILPPTLPPTLPPSLPPTLPPTLPPIFPPTKPPTIPSTVSPYKPPTLPSTRPPTQIPTLPIQSTYPPYKPPTYPPIYLPSKPPTYPPIYPPTYTPSKPPTYPPIYPPTYSNYKPTYPPYKSPIQPPTYPPYKPPIYLPYTPSKPYTHHPYKSSTKPPIYSPYKPSRKPPIYLPHTPPSRTLIKPSHKSANYPSYRPDPYRSYKPSIYAPQRSSSESPIYITAAPIKRCYQKYCVKWRKIRYECHTS